MAALAYPFWFAVFPLVYMTPDKRNNPFLKFHVYQGGAIGLWGVVGLSALRAVLSFFVRWFILLDVLLFPVLKMMEWGVLLLVLYGAIGALTGKRSEIPFLSELVRGVTEEETSQTS